MGGQVTDKGEITGSGFVFQVTNCISPYPGIIAHIGFLETGDLSVNSKCSAEIDIDRRENTAKNHTATHLLQFALKHVLGEHISQAGSFVEDLRLRFDFNHHTPLTKSEIKEVELLINSKIRSNQKVSTYEIPYSEAQSRQDITQIFGEKYSDKVRVVDIDFSKELCGGTHVRALGDIGFFKVTKETGIAAGVRRIEAVTGFYAEKFVYDKQDFIESIAETLKTDSQKILARIDSMLETIQLLTKENKNFKELDMKRQVVSAIKQVEKVKGIPFIAIETSISQDLLNTFANEIMSELKSGILAIALKTDERCQLLIKVSDDFVEKNIFANDFIKKVAPIIQGGGGGKKNQAQAGGKDPSQIPQAFSKIKQLLEDM